MQRLFFILLTLVVSLNSFALTQEEFFWRLEQDDIYRGGYLFYTGKISPYNYTSNGSYYVLYKDGTGKYCTGSSQCKYIEYLGIRARYCWREDFDIWWKYESRGDVAVIGLSFTSYDINKVQIEMLSTHTDEQYQIIKSIVQQKINNLHQEYRGQLGVPLVYEVLGQAQRDQLNKYYIVLTPAQTLPFNNYDFHCPVSKDYKEVINSREHKAGTTYTL